MIGFQLSVNGKPQQTIGIGDLGMLSATVEWHRLKTKVDIHESLYVGSRAMSPPKDLAMEMPKHVHWQNIRLKVGDEVTIKVVETETADPPLPGMPEYPE
jgi:protein involved in polysaccharide export with SLBB domain